jgi:hypothetical protein
MVVLWGSPRLAYAAAPSSDISASLAVREGGDRGRLSRTMRTRLHLKPGQTGTKQLFAQYGDNSAHFLVELGQCLKVLEDSQRISKETIETAQDNPQFSVILQRAILGASQTSDAGRHRILAELVRFGSRQIPRAHSHWP